PGISHGSRLLAFLRFLYARQSWCISKPRRGDGSRCRLVSKRSGVGTDRLRFRRLCEELSCVQERTSERAVIARPWILQGRLTFKMRTHALDLRIEVIKIMQHEGFRKHG